MHIAAGREKLMSLDEAPSPEIEIARGRQLMAIERRHRTIEQLKIGSVAGALVLVITFILLQLDLNLGKAASHFDYVLLGVPTTIYVSLLSIVFASILALIGALGRLSSNPVANGAASLYVSIVRGTPLLVQLYLIYLGLPRLRAPLIALGVPPDVAQLLVLPEIPTGILALSINYGAYMTEIFRAGIQSISHGQREAAQAIGMSPWQTMWRIVLPQAIRVILPDVGNQFIAMQKDSSLVSVFGVWEITYRANKISRTDSSYLEMFIVAALMYWILTIVSSWGQRWLENRMSHAYER